MLTLHLTESYSSDILSNHKIPGSITTDLIRELYRTPLRTPSDSIRDALSDGQLASKIVACDMLYNTGLDSGDVLIVGGWYGALAKLLIAKRPTMRVTSLDIDPTVRPIAIDYVGTPNQFSAITGDMYNFQLYGDYGVVINTSCEHIDDLPRWLAELNGGQTVLLQSNNMFDHPDHINCCNSIFDLVEQAHEYVDIISCNVLYCPTYQRYTLLGQIK